MSRKLSQTKKMYTEHPFGEFDYNRDKYYEDMLCTVYAKKLKKTDVIYDIGCGKGYVIGFLKKRVKNKIIGGDLSDSAVKHCRSLGHEVYKMNNMKLKLPSNKSDFTISNGVIHHTPDARQSFNELVRITKPGKQIYVSVYKRHFFYHYVYVGTKPVRMLYQKGPKSKKFVYKAIFPFFRWLYLVPIFYVLERKVISKQTSLVLFADQILTPQATFHSRKEMEKWIKEENCKVVKFAVEKKGQMISFIIEKKTDKKK